MPFMVFISASVGSSVLDLILSLGWSFPKKIRYILQAGDE